MRMKPTRILERLTGERAITFAIAFSGVILVFALCVVDTARRASQRDAAWLAQRLAEKRALVRALQADLTDVAQATERVSQMASIAREQNVAVRRQAGLEESRDAAYTPARLAALDDATMGRSDDGARAIAQLAFLEEQLAATTDSLSLLTVLTKTTGVVDPVTPARPQRAAVQSAVLDEWTPGGWPVVGDVSSRFGWRESPYGSGTQRHTGLDIMAAYGTPVRVSAPGVVVFAGRDSGGYGSTVVVDHGHNVKTLYGHLSGIYVREGQRVARATAIGAVGNTGRSTGVHLHYEVRVGNVPVDPMMYVRTDGVQQVASASKYGRSR
jgi:murein DD-endopeptidase MepM/ murein hydrolase activator NlpD